MTPPDPPQLSLYDLMGFSVRLREPGRVVMDAEVRPDLCNRRGVVHGGVISALLDSALGAAVVAGIGAEEWCATMQLSVQFLGGGVHGPLQAEGRLTQRGRRAAFAAGEVTDARGTRIAQAHGTWYVWPSRPPLPGAAAGPGPSAGGRPPASS